MLPDESRRLADDALYSSEKKNKLEYPGMRPHVITHPVRAAWSAKVGTSSRTTS